MKITGEGSYPKNCDSAVKERPEEEGDDPSDPHVHHQGPETVWTINGVSQSNRRKTCSKRSREAGNLRGSPSVAPRNGDGTKQQEEDQ